MQNATLLVQRGDGVTNKRNGPENDHIFGCVAQW